MNKDNPLIYQSGEHLLPKGWKFKISPSKFSSFINSIHNWYKTEVLKENDFTYSTSTVIGTICHYVAECVSLDKEVDKVAINEYIDGLEVHEDYNPSEVRLNYPTMAERLVNDYLLFNKDQYLEVEPFKYAEIRNGYFVGGSLDVVQGTKEDCMISDYKTFNSKTKPKTIPIYYKYQLLVYAYILKMNGYNPTRIRLIYVSRPIDGRYISEKTGKECGKIHPSEVTVLTEVITDEDLEFISKQLSLCVDTVEAGIKHPELRSVIYHDNRISNKTGEIE